MTLNFSPWNFFLVFGRTAALVAFFPMLQEAQIPRAIRAGIAIWLSLAILPMIPAVSYQPATLIDFAIGVGLETIVGVLFAITLRLIFSTVLLGAQWMDGEVGFQAAQQISPLTGTPNTPLGTIALVIATLLFWSLGFFEEMIVLWAKLFLLLPPPILAIPPAAGETLFKLSSQIFFGALQIATPILAIMFLVSIVIGLIARALQGASIFVESFNFKILVGMASLISLAPLLLLLIHKQLTLIPEWWTTLARSLVVKP